MSIKVLVPPLGQTVDTLTFVSWLKDEGDVVRQGEALFMIETDKATLEVEAPASGILRQVTARPGDEVKVLSAIATIAEPGEAEGGEGASPPPSAGTADPVVPPNRKLNAEAAGSSPRQRVFVSPRARRLIEAEEVPLGEIKPSGPEGAVIERDVRAYIAQRQMETTRRSEPTITPVARRMAEEAGLEWQTLSGTGLRGQVTREDIETALAGRAAALPPAVTPPPVVSPHLPASTQAEASETIPLAGVRGTIANRMQQSHSQTAPVTLTAEADATALVQLRGQLAADGVAVSYNDLFLYILARVLREQPRLNASLAEDAIKLWRGSISGWPWTRIGGCSSQWCEMCPARDSRDWQLKRPGWPSGRAPAAVPRRSCGTARSP
jgi:pyruvate dehydrogenase E2 component (dihydrolipoamide acetyltransferase)